MGLQCRYQNLSSEFGSPQKHCSVWEDAEDQFSSIPTLILILNNFVNIFYCFAILNFLRDFLIMFPSSVAFESHQKALIHSFCFFPHRLTNIL